MLIFRHFFSIFIFLSLLLTSLSYSQVTGVAKKAGGVGLAIQGVKVGKEGLKQLTKYGQELVVEQDNQTEEQIQQSLQQQNTKANQQIEQTKSNNPLDNLASSLSDSADRLKTNLGKSIDKNTKPLQNTVNSFENLFAKVKDSVSSDDNEASKTTDKEQSAGKQDKNNKNDDDIDEQTSQKIDDIVEYAKTHKGGTKSGYNGGGKFNNDGRKGGQILPKKDAKGNDITYKEYDVNPKPIKVNTKKANIDRDAQRVVIGSDGKIYYTKDHYKTFIEVK
jgi:guanyl-specific ribonuclease Sa